VAYYILGKYAPAYADFNSALKLNPKEADSYYLRSLAGRKLGRLSDADRDLATARQLDPHIEAEMGKIGLK